MNINDNLDRDLDTFSLNPESRDYLITSAKWAKIIALITLISIGVGVLVGGGFITYAGFLSDDINSVSRYIEPVMLIGIIFYLGLILVAMIPFYFLYKFAAEINANLIDFKGVSLKKGIEYLKLFFRTIAIFILITIVLYTIAMGLLVTSF